MSETVATAVCADCLDYMKSMPARSVQLTFCSPPYEVARTYGIAFPHKGQAWVDWCAPRFLECLRVTDGLVAWVVEGQTRQYRYSAAPMLLMADLHRRGVHLRKPPAFARVGIPGSGGPDWLRNDYEFIVCATNGGKLPWSDNTAMGHPPKWAPGGEMSHRLSDGTRRNQWGGGEKSSGAELKANGERRKAGRPSHTYGTVGGPGWGMPVDADLPETPPPTPRGVFGNQQSSVGRRPNGDRKAPYFNGNGHPGKRMPDGTMAEQGYGAPVLANPGNVIKCIVGGGVMGSKLAHENEAPFPESLAEFFVRSFCRPGGTVLDPFCGSGTTLAAAIKHGRNAIGIDIRQSQVDLTHRRIAEATEAIPR